jgi:hypothetical protein
METCRGLHCSLGLALLHMAGRSSGPIYSIVCESLFRRETPVPAEYDAR